MRSNLADPQAFTVLDWIGTLLSAATAIALFTFPLVGRSFAAMFKDFNSNSELPFLTQLAISAWFPIVLALLVVGFLAVGLRTASPISRRRAWVVVAFFLGCVSVAVCLVGVYLPIFSLAGAIKAE